MTEQMNVPKLRFSEFEYEFKETSLEDLTNKKISYGIVQAGPHVPHGMPYIKSTNLNKELCISSLERTSSQIAQAYKRSEVNPGDIVFSLRGNIGATRVVPDSITVANLTQGTARISIKDNLSNLYINYCLKTHRLYKRINSVSKGSTFQEISLADLRQVKVSHTPDTTEQHKIASFLSKVDKKTELLSKKKDKLIEYKKGVMQQLFNGECKQNAQDGKATFITPTLRFKSDDGSDFPDWQEKKLRDVCIVNPKSKSLPKSFKYIDLEAVNKGSLGSTDLLDIENAPSRAQRLLKQNDIIYQCVRPYQQNNYFFMLEGVYVASTGYAQLRAKITPSFVYYTIHTELFNRRVLSRCTGTSYPAINSSDLAGIKVGVPKSEEEQTKIAHFLSAIDQKIELANSELEKNKHWKKGLLQQMFV